MNLGISDIRELTTAMSVYPNMDYTEYAFSFLKRRLASIFNHFNIRKVSNFIDALPQENFRDQIIKLMCVSTTEMFRDPAFWRALRDNVLEALPEECDTIWLPHETGGEEAFSLAIILHENNLAGKYRIICNNPSLTNCNNIKGGKIKSDHFDVSQTNYKRLEDKDNYNEYLKKENGFITVHSQISKQVECINGNIITSNKTGKVGLIIFRNIAIYYNSKKAETILRDLIENLMPGGYIAIGVKEKMPPAFEEELTIIDKSEKIYQKPNLNRNNQYAQS